MDADVEDRFLLMFDSDDYRLRDAPLVHRGHDMVGVDLRDLAAEAQHDFRQALTHLSLPEVSHHLLLDL